VTTFPYGQSPKVSENDGPDGLKGWSCAHS
jgi:hypothetical protein